LSTGTSRAPSARTGRTSLLQLDPPVKGFDVGSRKQAEMRALCEGFISSTVRGPATAAALTPGYPWGCKRPIIASTYYDAFNRDDVELVPHEVTSMTPTGIVDATGAEREIDVLILSPASSRPGSWPA
jgi:cation diffusion facilitator CzcD-associated flavoprotein CzcO